jgi:aerobic-type carbon monoxide dehydrogenase small subunit (CoxS/CutS family)
MADSLKLTVNGKPATIAGPGERSLLEVLREDLHLTGTKYGCGEGACGACSVIVEGKRVFSCSTPVSECAGKSVLTIEGLAKGDELHPVQEAFLAEGAFQCGYCTAGWIMGTVAMLQRTPNPTEAQIVETMNGHLCRCCTYVSIRDAIARAATASAARAAAGNAGRKS